MQTAKRVQKRCLVDFQLRQNPAVLYARDPIRKKKLGNISYIAMQWSIGSFGEKALPPLPAHMQWRESVAQAGSGALAARGVHLFDLLRFLTGQEVIDVMAKSDGSSRHVDRTALGIFTLSGGTSAIATTSKQIPAAGNGIAIHGTNGALILDIFGKENTVRHISAIGTEDRHFPNPNLWSAVFDTFADAASKNMNATAIDGTKAIAITEAFQRSATTKKSVRPIPVRS